MIERVMAEGASAFTPYLLRNDAQRSKVTAIVEIDEISLKERLWHSLRADLSRYFPEIIYTDRLMCCTCGRFLEYDDFTLEHIIPQQSLADDPVDVRQRVTANQRSGVILLCNKPLKLGGKEVYSKGCNSFKGRFYDSRLRQVFNRSAFDARRHVNKFNARHHVATFCAAFLAMVRHYGYQVALTQSGAQLRKQFFMPEKFSSDIQPRFQVVMFGEKPAFRCDDDINQWSQPFTFSVERDVCFVVVRGLLVCLPVSRDPTAPIAVHLPIKPSKYMLRPNLSVFFE